MNNVDVAIQSIVTHQQNVVGPLAVEQANEVTGISVSDDGKVKISLKKPSDSKAILGKLVQRYSLLFGQASVEVCKDALKESGVELSEADLPDILK